MSEQHAHNEEEQQRIAELVRSFDAPAPQSLHNRIDSLVAARQDSRLARRAQRRFSAPAFAAVGAIVAVVVALVIAIGTGGGSAPTLSVGQAVASTLATATLPAPPESHTNHGQLLASVDGVPFPYWGERFGWQSAGARSDQIDGRAVTTVFYADSGGRRIGYAIVAGSPAPSLAGGVSVWRGGVSYRLLSEHGAAVVAWLRRGHLCVIAGRGVSRATLLRLASWSEAGSTAV
jgi:hypothetical protein